MTSTSDAAAITAIESVVAERTGRACIFVPSGRMALYLAFRALLPSGGRLLMSPLQDDVVLFTALAAGLRPVMAPVRRADGNIDVAAIADAEWDALDGVLTTNLYGLPDSVSALAARCDAHGVTLVEDVAHAIATDVDGTPVGTFGAAAAFSLSKHVRGAGGLIAVADDGGRPEIEAARDRLLDRNRARRGWDWERRRLVERLDALHVGVVLRRVRAAVAGNERSALRMALRPDDLRHALDRAPNLMAFDPWVRVDRHSYRRVPASGELGRTLRRLQGLEAARGDRVRGVARLATHPAVAPAVAAHSTTPLFRVPLLVEDRDRVLSQLRAAGVATTYIFDPPLDDYAGAEFVDPASRPAAARWWADHVLPIDPCQADDGIARAAAAGIELVPAGC